MSYCKGCFRLTANMNSEFECVIFGDVKIRNSDVTWLHFKLQCLSCPILSHGG